MINDQPPIPPRRQLCDERCAGGLAVTACYTTKWDVTAEELAARKCALACLLTFEQSPTSQIFTPKLRGELPFVQKSKPFVPGTFPAFCGLRYPRP